MRDPHFNLALQGTISAPRLARYLAQVDGDLDAAITLYERNTRLAESLYTPLQSVEICLRNTLDQQMRRVYGATWLTDPAGILHGKAVNWVLQVKAHGPEAKPDNLVAEMKFAFWVSLLGPAYDSTLWRRALHRGFSGVAVKRRSVVHSRFNAIRRLRNRVAHHEPILDKAEQLHSEIIEAIGWMSAETMEWTSHQSRFERVWEDRRAI